jgi:AcrR family transcriptional regulator
LARRYQQGRRKEAAAETRARIVRATFDLHAEQGMVGTTMKQIAERAEVSVGSVYNHFPSYDEAILACGAYAFSLGPEPSTALFEDVNEVAERVRRLACAVFAQFERLRAFGYVAAEQDRLPVLKGFVEQERAQRLSLAAAALGEPQAGERARTLAALLDHGVYQALKDIGLGTDAAADRAAEVANAWLAAREP